MLEQAAFQPSGFVESFVEVAALLEARTFHMTHDPGTGPPDIMLARENIPFLEAYLDRDWVDQDIWTQICRETFYKSKLEVLTDTLIIPKTVRQQSAFFQEFYRNWDVAHVACWCFKAGNADLGFTIKRPKNRPFSEADTTLLAEFKRAANRVGLLVTQFHQQHVQGFLQGLEASNKPSMALNHKGEISYMTPSAENLVGDGFSVRQGVPFGFTPRADAGFLALRKWARRPGPDLPEAFVIDRMTTRHPIAAIPVAIPDDGLVALPFARVVVLLLDLSDRAGTPKALLQSMFGLTGREADVAALLSCGLSVEEIAHRLSLRLASTRQVVKSVLSKAGVHRQSELVAMLGRLH